MRNFRSFNRNLKAISPIFATLILIAIAVIAGVVVYMFTSGALSTMQGSSGGAQERMAVQSVQYTANGATSTVAVLIQNTGTANGVCTGIIVKNAAGNTVATATGASLSATALTAGSLNSITGTIAALPTPGSYTVTVTTQAGGSFVSSSFTA